MRQTGRESNIRSLIGFELFLKTACLSFFVPLLGMLFDFCLWASGYSYLTKENLPEFLMAPGTLVCAILVLCGGVYLLCIEVHAVGLAVRGSFSGNRLTVSELFFKSVSKTGKMLRKKSKLRTKITRQEMLAFLCGMIKRGVLLFVSEGLLYGVGLVLLIVCVTKTADSQPAGVILLRIVRRYRVLAAILFFSVNTVVLEYFCVELWYTKKVGKSGNPVGQKVESGRQVRSIGEKTKLREVCFRFACVLVAVTAIAQTVSFFRNGNVFMSEALEELCITAHRGASGEAPENTLAAIGLAVEQGADYAEIDVRLTADGVPVLLHDEALFRTTGVLNDVDCVTYEELSTYDAGIRYAKEFAGQRVPSLREVFEEYGGDIGFNIELKTKQDKALAFEVVHLIEEYGLEESCIVTSVSYRQLQWVKELNGELKTGHILSMVYGDFYENDAADFFSIRSDCVTELVVEKAHAHGKEIHVWTVNRENELKRMKAIGVDNIITNTPAYAREIVQKDKEAESLGEWLLLLTSKK